MSLRRAFLISAMTFAAIAITAGVALIYFTTLLHRFGGGIEDALESTRIAEELEVELLSYRGAVASLSRATTESRLRQLILGSRHYVGSSEEAQLVADLERQTHEYVQAVDRAAPTATSLAALQQSTQAEFDVALQSTRQLIEVNLEQGRALRRSAERADQMANFIGAGVLIFVVGGLGVLGLWLRAAAFRPAIELARTIENYAKGERDARATAQGAEEFRRIAHHFNEMASTIERQRKDQLAFLAGVAHDLRNPLSALEMATALISPDKPLPPEDRIRQLVARMQRQTNRLERMVSDFLDAARIEAGTLELQMEECDVRMIARATIDLFEPTAPNHRLVVDAPDQAVNLMCDPARIEQVLNNLVSNAIKYSPRGGEVRVLVENREDAVAIAVSDEGVGISPEDRNHLFEPFRRGGAATGSIAGVGLGLFVARKIVEAHGGRITITSEVGRGSTFTLVLPRKQRKDVSIARPRLSDS